MVTVFLHCPTIGSRGVLVHELLYAHREALGMTSWYIPSSAIHGEGYCLHPDAPIEVLHVAKSRRPYFLVEFRYPTVTELSLRRTQEGSEKKKERTTDGTTAVPPMPSVSVAELQACTRQLLTQGPQWSHSGRPVQVSQSMGDATVASEREKQRLRDAREKKKRVEAAEQQTQRQATTPKKAASGASTVFVPRVLRRCAQ